MIYAPLPAIFTDMKIIIIVSSVLTFMVCTYGIALAKEMTLLQPGTRDDYGSGSGDGKWSGVDGQHDERR